MTSTPDPARWIDVLAGSHDRIADIVGAFDADDLRRPSYCDGWTVAHVLSHLGSGAEIFTLMLEAGVAGDPPLPRDVMAPIWARWNALAPEEQAEAFLSTDGQLVERLENLGDGLDTVSFTFFGMMELDAVGMVGMRLSEHAVHTWDVAVSLEPHATVDADAVALLVDRLPAMAARAGRSDTDRGSLPSVLLVETTDPTRRFTLHVDSTVRLSPAGEAAPAEGDASAPLRLPAEALLRLVYGRLDRGHSPRLGERDQELVGSLRAVFPGL